MTSSSNPQHVDVEVLPPDEHRGDRNAFSGGADALPRLIALFMDNLFAVPGTKLRFGLNPLLDLLPVFGDGAAALISSLTLFAASRSGMPRVVLARMGLNILLNSAMGVIPGVGEVFAFWYRPNLRNYELLKKHLTERGSANRAPSTRGDWLFVSGLIGAVMLMFGLCIGAGAFFFFEIVRVLTHK